MTWLLATLGVLLLKLVLDELLDWCPWLAERVVRRAAGRVPTDVRERYTEEWLAELDALPGKGLSKLVFAVRVLSDADAVADAVRRDAPKRRSQIGVRLFDLQLSAVFLVVFAPLIALIALAIRIAEGSPSFLREYRVEGGEIVASRLTFRTMRFPRETLAPGELIRPSTIGGWLLRFNLAALPAAVDVFRGDMTVVGPPPTAETKALGLKPGLIDWRLGFERPEQIATPRDPSRDPEWAAQWTTRRALRALVVAAWCDMGGIDPGDFQNW